MEFKKLLIVIPTRNRSSLAINAIESVLKQGNSDFEVLVSDNSTEEAETSALRTYCEQIEDKRLHYIAPLKPLLMTDHWNWAVQQGIQINSFSHITFLTDRMLFLDNSLSELEDILIACKSDVLSYSTDSIKDNETPVILGRMKSSGKVYEVSSLLLLSYYLNVEIIYQPLPRMMNCIVSLDVLNKIRNRFGNYFFSVSPDFNFAFRVLDMVDFIHFYDKSLLIQYGVEQSNGMNIVEGNFNKAAKDFIRNSAAHNVNFNTPVDYLYVMPNAVLHEYYEIKDTSESGKFSDVNREKYLASLVENVFNYKNPKKREEMMEKLKRTLGKNNLFKYRIKYKVQRYRQALNIKLQNLLNPSDPFVTFEEFDSVEQAILQANNFRRSYYDKLYLSKEGYKNNKFGTKILLEDLKRNIS